jgi:hypothetical protein
VFARIHILLRHEGWRKRTYRIYKEEELNLRSQRPQWPCYRFH